MDIRESKDLVSIHYDGISDFMNTSVADSNKSVEKSLARTTGEKWYGPGSKTHHDVTKFGILGNDALYESLSDKISVLKKEIGDVPDLGVKEVRRKRVRAGQGDEIDIHQVYQGNIDRAWSKTERFDFDGTAKLVTLLIDNEDGSWVNANDSLWRAAAACAMYESLIKAGKSVRVVTYGATRRPFTTYQKNMTVTITIKGYSEQLSVRKLASMAHCGFARGPGFFGMMRCGHKLDVGLGTSVKFSPEYIPIQMKDEIALGGTKVLYIGKSNNMGAAVDSLKNATESLLG